jgi:hypothetical protein
VLRPTSGIRGWHGTRSDRAACLSRMAFLTPSSTSLPSASMVFLSGGGSSIPAVSLNTHLSSCKFCHARRLLALDLSSSSRIAWSSCGLIDMVGNVHPHTTPWSRRMSGHREQFVFNIFRISHLWSRGCCIFRKQLSLLAMDALAAGESCYGFLLSSCLNSSLR